MVSHGGTVGWKVETAAEYDGEKSLKRSNKGNFQEKNKLSSIR